jgi:transposase-like protein
MITTAITHQCRHCGSENIVKNGHNSSGSQQYWCKECDRRGVLNPKRGYTQEQKEQIIAAYYERPSMRGIQRIHGVSPNTLASWLKKKTSEIHE